MIAEDGCKALQQETVELGSQSHKQVTYDWVKKPTDFLGIREKVVLTCKMPRK